MNALPHVATSRKRSADSKASPEGQEKNGHGAQHFWAKPGCYTRNKQVALGTRRSAFLPAGQHLVSFGTTPWWRGTNPFPREPTLFLGKHPFASQEGSGAVMTEGRPHALQLSPERRGGRGTDTETNIKHIEEKEQT